MRFCAALKDAFGVDVCILGEVANHVLLPVFFVASTSPLLN